MANDISFSSESLGLRGDKNPNAKLTNCQAQEIRQSPLGCRRLAKQFSVSISIIKRIRSGKAYLNNSGENNRAVFNRPSLAERFWPRVDKSAGHGPNGDCWVWTAATNTNGYGVIRYGTQMEGAHRISFRLNSGEIVDGLGVLHSCDNRLCVNPAHLRLGTHQENMDEMVERGRHPKLAAGFRTHCKYGHEFTEKNTIHRSNGCRQCRECKKRTNTAAKKRKSQSPNEQ